MIYIIKKNSLLLQDQQQFINNRHDFNHEAQEKYQFVLHNHASIPRGFRFIGITTNLV